MPEPRPVFVPPLDGADEGSLVRLGLAEPPPIPGPAPSTAPFQQPQYPGDWQPDEPEE
ncbi:MULTISPECIES: hypothetical protein [unclassified Streptomyces]|uniref:hypothetical protein n=1 Tax=unclassified Streptomyces TaxID=2593676 RepID=UPI00081E4060|nr:MULTISPECIES: hypothetical protein [unclassified Streptomyces]MYR28079.1 hypothetical protein [Streptomyces sp. SID4945]SCF33498.1 hypothetical protein GA0115257_111636 [Streptomyces sp. LcepLS]